MRISTGIKILRAGHGLYALLQLSTKAARSIFCQVRTSRYHALIPFWLSVLTMIFQGWTGPFTAFEPAFFSKIALLILGMLKNYNERGKKLVTALLSFTIRLIASVADFWSSCWSNKYRNSEVVNSFCHWRKVYAVVDITSFILRSGGRSGGHIRMKMAPNTWRWSRCRITSTLLWPRDSCYSEIPL